MRFYEIIVSNADGSQFMRWGSIGVLTGTVDPSAPEVELDIPVGTYDQPYGQAAVKIYGVGLDTLKQSKQFAGKSISVARGMSAGLPLANPMEQGVAVKGTIFQGYGNWVGTNMSLDLIFTAATGSDNSPMNFTINWKAGTPLSQALTQSLKTALPSLVPNIQISSNLVLNYDQVGSYASLEQFAAYLSNISQKIIKTTNYPGVKVTISNGKVIAYDTSTTPSQVTDILFTDLIGQPTWIDLGTVQCHLVMRGDLQPGDVVTLPNAQQNFTAASNSQFQDSLNFSGKFTVSYVRDVGKFRSPNAENWITTVNLVPMSN